MSKLLDALRALIDDPDADGDSEETPETLSDGEEPGGDAPSAADDGEAGEAGADGDADGDDSLESVEGDESAGADDSDEGGQLSDETLPEGTQSPEELRDMLNNAYAVIESLRNRIAELGGDAAEGAEYVAEETADEPDESDDEYSYDDDEEEQRKQIAELDGK